MRVYHFLNERYGLEAISNKTLKVSRLKSLNDPFEYYHIDTENYGTRSILKERLNHANRELGIICFSRNYTSPAQWAHYGDSHRGICLGFDIPDSELFDIEYVERRTEGKEFKNSLDLKGMQYIKYMLSKKHEHWKYEQEVRMLVPFPEKIMDERLMFVPFAEKFSLREIMLGVRCATSAKKIKSYLGQGRGCVQVYKMEMSKTEYEIQLPEVLS
ncbi:DUF2971 domain-containing protein [Zhongshania aliphaticivorans]|uniref:DUF2971 domain-containing protein n=1 Tax=Zhongshania aliphaticivorans TaxID=1470434 RepID=UPI0012E51132|nr:DUF2971 domain-containing protein [Zhongshania aliphaticivorans]CAA0113258.1 Uncharacterised protein [Zhongshania aliphaticivorans]